MYKDPAIYQQRSANALNLQYASVVWDEIQAFIDEFVKRGGPESIVVFTHGLCYWFATILMIRFEDNHPALRGVMMYNPIDNHWAVDFGGKLFDITGVISNEGYVKWDEYRNKETHPRNGPSSHLSSLICECILLYSGDRDD